MTFKLDAKYMNDFAKACSGYGLDDMPDIVGYYKDFADKQTPGKTDLPPQDLARRYALSRHAESAFYDLDDDYFDEFIEIAKKRFDVDSDDFLLDFWAQKTKRQKKTEETPEEFAFQAKREYAHSPFKAQKKFSIADLDAMRAKKPGAPAPAEKIEHFNQLSLKDMDLDELRDEYGSGFYWMYKYEGNPKFVLVGNTVWDGKGDKQGEDVRLCFNSTASKDDFCRMVWSSRDDPASDHVKAGVKRSPSRPTSSAKVTDELGTVSKWRKGRLQGYRNDKGDWVDVFEDDPEFEAEFERRERRLNESAEVESWMLRLCGEL